MSYFLDTNEMFLSLSYLCFLQALPLLHKERRGLPHVLHLILYFIYVLHISNILSNTIVCINIIHNSISIRIFNFTLIPISPNTHLNINGTYKSLTYKYLENVLVYIFNEFNILMISPICFSVMESYVYS